MATADHSDHVEDAQSTASATQLAAHRAVEMLVRSRESLTAPGLMHEFEDNCDRVSRRPTPSSDISHEEWIPTRDVSLGEFFGNELFNSTVADAFVSWVTQHDDYTVAWEFEDTVLGVERFGDGAILVECEITGSWWGAALADEVLLPVGVVGPVEAAVDEYGDIRHTTGPFTRPQGHCLREHR